MVKGKLIFCIVILVAEVMVHVLSYIPASRVSLGVTWPLHVAIFPMWLVVILDSHGLPGYPPRCPAETKAAYMNRLGLEGNAQLLCLFRCVPPKILVPLLIILFYLFMTMILMFGDKPVGSTEEKDGRYFVVNHGERTEVTREERNLVDATAVRRFSAIWVIFSLLGTCYFLYARPALLALRRACGGPPPPVSSPPTDVPRVGPKT